MASEAHRIFFSHKLDAMPFVSEVAAELRRRGLNPWIAREQLDLDDDWHEQLSVALAESDTFVVFVGPDTRSPWTYFEIGAAVGRAKRLLPVYLTNDVTNAPPVLARVAGIQAYDLTPDQVAERIAQAVEVG
jgi:TIR domain